MMARHNLSQTDLAARLGRNQQWLSRRLGGHTAITVSELLLIASALGVTSADLLPAEHKAAS